MNLLESYQKRRNLCSLYLNEKLKSKSYSIDLLNNLTENETANNADKENIYFKNLSQDSIKNEIHIDILAHNSNKSSPLNKNLRNSSQNENSQNNSFEKREKLSTSKLEVYTFNNEKIRNDISVSKCLNQLPKDCIRIIYDFYGGTEFAWNGLKYILDSYLTQIFNQYPRIQSNNIKLDHSEFQNTSKTKSETTFLKSNTYKNRIINNKKQKIIQEITSLRKSIQNISLHESLIENEIQPLNRSNNTFDILNYCSNSKNHNSELLSNQNADKTVLQSISLEDNIDNSLWNSSCKYLISLDSNNSFIYTTHTEEEWDKNCFYISLYLFQFALVSSSFYQVYMDHTPVFQLLRNGYSNINFIQKRLSRILPDRDIYRWQLEVSHLIADNQLDFFYSLIKYQELITSEHFKFWNREFFFNVLNLNAFDCIEASFKAFGRPRDSTTLKDIVSSWMTEASNNINILKKRPDKCNDSLIPLVRLKFSKQLIQDNRIQAALTILLFEESKNINFNPNLHLNTPVASQSHLLNASQSLITKKSKRSNLFKDFQPFAIKDEDEIQFEHSGSSSVYYDYWKLYCIDYIPDNIESFEYQKPSLHLTSKSTNNIAFQPSNYYNIHSSNNNDQFPNFNSNFNINMHLPPSKKFVFTNFESIPEEYIPKLLFEFNFQNLTKEKMDTLRKRTKLDNSWLEGLPEWNILERCLARWIFHVYEEYEFRNRLKSKQEQFVRIQKLICLLSQTMK